MEKKNKTIIIYLLFTAFMIYLLIYSISIGSTSGIIIIGLFTTFLIAGIFFGKKMKEYMEKLILAYKIGYTPKKKK